MRTLILICAFSTAAFATESEPRLSVGLKTMGGGGSEAGVVHIRSTF